MGRSDHLDYARYHEVLNRAVWSPRQAARILLMLLLQHLDQGDGPLVFGIDETLEQAPPALRGKPRASTATRCVPVASNWSRPAACAISLMWLGQIPWAGRWALPFIPCWRPRNATTGSAFAATRSSPTGLPAADCNCPLAAPPPPGAGGRQQLRRLLHCCQSLAQPVTLIARLRLDAALYEPPHPVSPVRTVGLR